MNEEKKLQLEIFLKFVVIFICAGLYAWGGMEYKFLRRFVAPSLCALSLLYFTRDWKSLIVAPFLGMASSLGYGASDLWVKIFKRFYVGAAFATGANAFKFFSIRDNARIIIYSSLAIISAYILFGVWGLMNARTEESFLGLTVYMSCILPSKRKEV